MKNIRYICLYSEPGDYISEDFSFAFSFNVRYICNYLSKAVRKLKIPVCGEFNMISVRCSSSQEDRVKKIPIAALDINLYLPEKEIADYLKMKTLEERTLFLLEWIEEIVRDRTRNLKIEIKSVFSFYDYQLMISAFDMRTGSLLGGPLV